MITRGREAEMLANGYAALLCALVLFTLYFANVALGAARMGAPLGDVGEMLMLFASALFFVVGILQREAKVKKTRK